MHKFLEISLKSLYLKYVTSIINKNLYLHFNLKKYFLISDYQTLMISDLNLNRNSNIFFI